MNFLLALLIYILVFFKWGEEYVPVESMVYGYSFEQEFKELGLENGDKILSLDGEKVDRWLSIHHDIVVNETRVIQVEREGVIMDIQVPEGMTSKLLKLEYVMEPRVPCEVDDMQAHNSLRYFLVCFPGSFSSLFTSVLFSIFPTILLFYFPLLAQRYQPDHSGFWLSALWMQSRRAAFRYL